MNLKEEHKQGEQLLVKHRYAEVLTQPFSRRMELKYVATSSASGRKRGKLRMKEDFEMCMIQEGRSDLLEMT